MHEHTIMYYKMPHPLSVYLFGVIILVIIKPLYNISEQLRTYK